MKNDSSPSFFFTSDGPLLRPDTDSSRVNIYLFSHLTWDYMNPLSGWR